MLSKFKYEKETFVPYQSLIDLNENLDAQLDKIANHENAVDVVKDALIDIIYFYEKMILMIKNKNTSNFVQYYLGFKLGFISVDEKNTIEIFKETIQAYEKALAASQSLESLFLHINKMIPYLEFIWRDAPLKMQECAIRYEIDLIKKLISQAIVPYCSSEFKEIMDCYELNYIADKNNWGYRFMYESDKFEKLKKLDDEINTLYYKNKALLSKNSDWLDTFIEEYPDIEPISKIYRNLVKIIKTKLKEINILDVTSYMHYVKFLMTLDNRTIQLIDRLTNLKGKLKDKIAALKNHVVPSNLSGTAALSIFPSSDDSIIKNIFHENKSEINSDLANYKIFCDNKYEEKKENTIKIEPPKDSSRENVISIKSRTRKTIEKIFDSNPKIKYKHLITLTDTLCGEKRIDSGSSSRKFKINGKTIFMHQPHKYRKKYIDPNVIEDIKDILSALNITPDHHLFSLENSCTKQNNDKNISSHKKQKAKSRKKF